jgi:hypothetical protein
VAATLAKGAARLAISGALEPALLRLVDSALHAGLSQAIDLAPDGAMSDESEQELERLAHTVVREVLDEVLTGPAAAELEAHGEHVVAAALHRNGSAAQSEASAALSTMAAVVARVLHEHRKDLVEVATRVLTKATVEVATDKVEIRTKPVEREPERNGQEARQPATEAEEVEPQDATPPRHDRAKQDTGGKDSRREVRDQLSDAGETLMRQLSAETEKLQARLKEEMGSAVKKGTQNQKLGRAPTGGHPSAGHSVPRGPSQGAPGTRRRK